MSRRHAINAENVKIAIRIMKRIDKPYATVNASPTIESGNLCSAVFSDNLKLFYFNFQPLAKRTISAYICRERKQDAYPRAEVFCVGRDNKDKRQGDER